MIKKNEEYIVEIIDAGVGGEGIAKIDNFTIFIEGALVGEKVKVHILKVNASYAFAKIVEIIEKSSFREEPFCSSYRMCGGCDSQHMSYEETLRIKLNKVKSTLKKSISQLVDEELPVYFPIGMGIPFHYRNKVQYPVRNGKIGFYKDRTHEVIENDTCLIQDEESDKLAKRAFEMLMENGNTCYDEKTLTGNIRHIMVRCGKNTGELMLVIITNEEKINGIENIISDLTKEFNLKSIIQNINKDNTNIIMGEKCITLYGNDTITDTLGDYNFKISPLSFYQVNPVQTEVLYNVAKEYANLSKDDVVYDLYCGIGTIGSFVSDSCKKVFGVEVVKEAVEDAIENAKLNDINNIEFVCGTAEDVIPKMYEEGNRADVVFVDPPRKGCDEKLLKTIIDMKAKRIVYISCNVATLARDLRYLLESGDYKLEAVQPVDMFPWTAHVEVISVLNLK